MMVIITFWQLNRPVSQIDIQRNMVGFVMEGHIKLWAIKMAISSSHASHLVCRQFGPFTSQMQH